MTTVPSRLWLAGAVALLVLTAAGCSTDTSSSTVSTGASIRATGGSGQHSGTSGSTSISGISSGSSQPKRSGGSGSPGSGRSGSSGSGGPGSSGSGGSGSSQSNSGTNVTLPSLSDQFNADASSFESTASSAQQAVGQLLSNASAQQVAAAVAPLMAAATTFQSQLVSLQWSAAAQPDAQSLNENLGKLTAVIHEAQRSDNFGSAPQFRSQLSSAIDAVDGALSSVSAGIG